MSWLLAEAAPPITVPTWFWEGFVAGVVVLLLLDLLVFHRKPHEVRTSEAILWSAVWIGLALLFNAWVWWEFGPEHGKNFFVAFVVEKSLSVDNLFVFLVIFNYFKVPPALQHRVLFFGVLGAIVMRFVFIMAGIALIERFSWVNWIFGAFLVFTAMKLLFAKEEDPNPENKWFVRLIEKVLPFTPQYHEGKLTVVTSSRPVHETPRHEAAALQSVPDDETRQGAGRELSGGGKPRRIATMLLLVVLIVEATDVAFAVDSIPAVIGITQERFIVFTSNIAAILGLRAIYFLLARFMGAFHYLKPGLALVLAFVGVKLFGIFHVLDDSTVSLAVICGILTVATVASILRPEQPKDRTTE
jgi:tellurite resistance protein TerC